MYSAHSDIKIEASFINKYLSFGAISRKVFDVACAQSLVFRTLKTIILSLQKG